MFKNLNLIAINIRNVALPEGLALAQSSGFGGFDPGIGEVEQLAQQKSVEYVKELFTRAGVKPGAWSLPVNYRGDDPVYYEHLAKLPARAKLAADIGLNRCYVVIAGWDDKKPFKDNFDFHVRRLRTAAEILRGYGHSLGMEFIGPATSRGSHKYNFLYTMDGMLALAAAIGTGNVGLLFDVWHAWTAHATLADIKKLSSEDVIYVHINDAPKGIDIDQQIDNIRGLPGETGVIPVPEMLRILKEIGYTGPVTPEPFSKKLEGITPQEAAKIAIEATNKVWQAAGLG